jgi:methionyl-tRNA formyltransferase
MRLVYLGTPEAAVPPLQALVQAGHQVQLVVSQPDRKRGRGGAVVPSPVKRAAMELGLPVTDAVDEVLGTTAELGVVVAFGRLIKPNLLAHIPFVNIHFSLLPRWRGAAPVERAILAGDAQTGCCLMALEAGMDTGPVYRREASPILPLESAEQLRQRLVVIGTNMLTDALADGFNSLGSPMPQAGTPTHAAKLRPEEFQIDWAASVNNVHGTVRIGHAWTMFRGKRLKVVAAQPADSSANSSAASSPVLAGAAPGSIHGHAVQCADGLLQLITVQPEGKAPMAVSAWVNGAHPADGDLLGAVTSATPGNNPADSH